jgi:hypothetical protein
VDTCNDGNGNEAERNDVKFGSKTNIRQGEITSEEGLNYSGAGKGIGCRIEPHIREGRRRRRATAE